MEKTENKYEPIILSYFLKDKSYISTAIQNGVKAEWFCDSENKNFFHMLVGYYYKHDNVLSKNVYMSIIQSYDIDPIHYPQYDLFYEMIEGSFQDDNSFDFYFNSFKDEYIYSRSLEEIKVFIAQKSKNKEDINTLLTNFTTKLNNLIFQKQGKKHEFIDYYEDIDIQLNDIRQRKENPELYSGLKTFIPSMDKFFNGFEKGTLNIVAGMTGTGKSTIMREFARRQCNLGKKKVLIISCEDDILIWSHKMTSAEAQIPLSSILRGEITNEQLNFIEEIKKNRIRNDSGYKIIELSAKQFTVQDIEFLIDQYTQNWIPDIVYLDQISLIAPIVRMKDRIDIEFGDITKALRSLAKKLNLPIVAASQVNRKAVKDKKGDRFVDINTENLSQSDQIGQDADSVLAIQIDKNEPEKCMLKIIKQRNGPKDINVELVFKGEYSSFLDAQYEYVNNGENEYVYDEGNSITKDANKFMTQGTINDLIEIDHNLNNVKSSNDTNNDILNNLPDISDMLNV